MSIRIRKCALDDCLEIIPLSRSSQAIYCSNRCKNMNARRRYDAIHRPIQGNTPKGIINGQTMTLDEFKEEADKRLDERVSIPNPPKKVLATKVKDMGFDTSQHAVACFSDYHYGGLVDPLVTGGIGGYNVATARTRLTDWRDGVLRFTQMLQVVVDVPELHILALGDDLEGNGHMFGTQALQMEMSVYFQYIGFVEDMTQAIVSLLQRFDKIHVYKVFGNHGRLSASKKDSYDPDNFELMAWQNIADRVERIVPGRVTFDISPAFFMIVNILGWDFYIRHGDGVNLRSTYTGPLDNKLATNSIIGKVIPYMVFGHHHTATEDEAEIDGDIISNGCFVGPSLFALKMRRPRANRPSQELFFVHPKKGITHRQRIHLAQRDEVRNITTIKR